MNERFYPITLIGALMLVVAVGIANALVSGHGSAELRRQIENLDNHLTALGVNVEHQDRLAAERAGNATVDLAGATLVEREKLATMAEWLRAIEQKLDALGPRMDALQKKVEAVNAQLRPLEQRP